MIQLYDYFGNAEIPNIILCNPNGDELYYLSQYIYNDKLSIKFNALSEFEFDIPSTVNNGITELEFYPYVQSKRLVFIQNIGYFVIYEVQEDTDGSNPIKKVLCRSIEGELITKKISAFSGTYKFYDPLHATTNLIDTVMELIPSWSIGTIDPLLVDKYRTYNITDTSIYSFLMVDVEKAMQCVFSFDFINKTISAYTIENATTDTDIFLSFDNLIEKIQLKEISDEIVTSLNVFGGNELTIRSVNPLGGNKIYNFDYFKTTQWMTQGLIDAIDAWEAAIAVAQSTYASNLTSLKTKNNELLDLQINPTTGLNKLLTDLSALEALQQSAVIAVPPDPVEIQEIADDIDAKELEISNKEAEITAKQAEIDAVEAILQGIVDSLAFDINFTPTELEELSLYIYENTYTNETIITTSIMTEAEKQDAAQDLYDQGVVVLEKVSGPRYEFSVDSANFIALKQFQQFTNQIVPGAIITIDKLGTLIETVLLEINFSFKNPTDFNLTFSNRLRLDNGSFQYSDILGQAVSTGNTVTTNSLVWQDWAQNYRDEVSTFITSSLDAATNNIVNSSNQEMVINEYGLRGRKLLSPGNYSPKQMWLTNNILAFTDDNWQTSKLALGTIETDAGTVSGLIADVIVGRLLAGNSLTITNDDGVVTRTFTLNQDGATLTNADFTIQNNVSKILLDPTNGIKIQKNTGTISVPVWTNQMYIDTNGNAVFSGNLSAATGSFSGSITASSGYIGRWVIDANGIKDPSGNNSMYLFSDGSVNLQFAGLDVYRATSTAGTGTLSYGGEIFEVPTADTVSFGINSSLSSNFYIWTDTFHMNGDAGVSGTFSGLTFVNGILVGT